MARIVHIKTNFFELLVLLTTYEFIVRKSVLVAAGFGITKYSKIRYQ